MFYFFPNRPLLLPIDDPQIVQYSNNSDYIAEVKKNGSRLCLHKVDGEYLWYNRDKKLLNYTPSSEVLVELESLNLPDNTHIDAELLHHKTKHIKNHIYVYDIYQYAGNPIMEPLSGRRQLLTEIFKSKSLNHFELATMYESDFIALFYDVIEKEENEGLVIKNLNGKIIWDMKKSPDVWWQIKVRKPNKNYKF